MTQTKMAREEYDQRGTGAVGSGTLEREQRENGGQAENRAMAGPRNAVKGWNELHLARGLGWFSLGLGLAEVLAPRRVTQWIGARGDHRGLMRLMGVREIASGLGMLAQRRPTASAWSRVAGDALDLALLGTAMNVPRAKRGRLAAATAAVAGVTALDVLVSQQLSRRDNAHTPGGAMRVSQSITINRSPEELYRFWRNFNNLSRFMAHLESVQVHDDKRSHWVAKAPAGMTVEWDAEIIEDHPNELIAWRSVAGADVDNTGSVRFERAPGGRGTVVRVRLQYNPPAGVVGATVAKLMGEDPAWQVKDGLRRFKQMMEVGEVITTEGQSAGRASSLSPRYDTAIQQ
jgi:uncharacterized membrane protein